MELIRKEQSLRTVFFKYLARVFLGFLVAILFVLFIFTIFYNRGFITPANHIENQILKNKYEISHLKKFDESLIPKGASYMLLSSDGEIVQTDMDKKTQLKAKNYHNREEISTPTSSFIELRRADGFVVINYSLEAQYNNAWMDQHFPKVNLLIFCLLILFSFINVLVVTVLWVKRINKQLLPIFEASDRIAKQELDFKIGSSKIKEFNDILKSLDQLKVALTDSLRENWIQEESKRNQISALTHDLKTPISIVQGNAELLKATELTEEQKEYIEYIVKNSKRISDYSKALMLVNKSGKQNILNLRKVKTSDLVERIRKIAKEISLIHERVLSESIDFEDGFIMIDLPSFERVVQNIFSNAVQYSPEGSSIGLEIVTTDKKLLISVLDNGSGFSKEDLIHGTEQFYRADKSRHSSKNYGLGLYIASEIMALHHGQISLENKANGAGAIVKLELPLL